LLNPSCEFTGVAALHVTPIEIVSHQQEFFVIGAAEMRRESLYLWLDFSRGTFGRLILRLCNAQSNLVKRPAHEIVSRNALGTMYVFEQIKAAQSLLT
jgi:hypothetical protein